MSGEDEADVDGQLSARVRRLLEEGGEDENDDDDDDDDEVGNLSGAEDSPLIAAARNGKTEEVISLLAEGDEVNQEDEDGSTPLLVACENGHAKTVSVLCAAGALLDQANVDGDTPLLLASEEGHTETASVLCASGATVDQSDTIGRTPLFLAIDNGHLALAQLLISLGASRSITVNGEERTALGMAQMFGHANLAAWLTTTEQWTTPLHHLSGPTAIGAARARALLRSGASLHAAADTGGPTPLSLAQIILAAGEITTDDGSAASLVLQAARPWSRELHALFPAMARARAVELLITGHRLFREPRFAEGAVALLDVWVGCVMPHAVQREEGEEGGSDHVPIV